MKRESKSRVCINLTICFIYQISSMLCTSGFAQKNEKNGVEELATSQAQIYAQQVYLDLDAIVTSQERAQWIVDDVALSEIAAELADVYCRLTAKHQQDVLKYLHGQEIVLGEAQRYWSQSTKTESGLIKGIDRKVFRDLLHKERILKSFLYAKERSGNCPYWLPKEDSYWGIHRDAGRLQLVAETMGGLQAMHRGGELFIGGSGQGRLFAVYGFGASWGLGIGIEAGGSSVFPRDESGARSVKAEWTGGAPLLARFWLNNYRLDAELAPVARFTDDEEVNTSYGGRFALAFGLSPLRLLGALPHVMIWAGAEHYFDEEETLIFRAGTRIGFSL